MTSSEIVKHVRLRSGMSQMELARKAGLTNVTICDWERGKTCPKVDSLLAVLRVTGFEMLIVERKQQYE